MMISPTPASAPIRIVPLVMKCANSACEILKVSLSKPAILPISMEGAEEISVISPLPTSITPVRSRSAALMKTELSTILISPSITKLPRPSASLSAWMVSSPAVSTRASAPMVTSLGALRKIAPLSLVTLPKMVMLASPRFNPAVYVIGPAPVVDTVALLCRISPPALSTITPAEMSASTMISVAVRSTFPTRETLSASVNEALSAVMIKLSRVASKLIVSRPAFAWVPLTCTSSDPLNLIIRLSPPEAPLSVTNTVSSRPFISRMISSDPSPQSMLTSFAPEPTMATVSVSSCVVQETFKTEFSTCTTDRVSILLF